MSPTKHPPRWPYTLLEQGHLPEWLIRLGIRTQLAQKSRELRPTTVEAHQATIATFIDGLRHSPIAIETQAANEQHYELPPQFFKLVLGKHLKYSSSYWSPTTRTLDDAELAMLNLTLERANITNGQSILDCGCGWGSLSLLLAERYPDSTVVGLSNSAPQRLFIEGEAKRRGLTNLTVWTDNIATAETTQRFDRILSVEMMEHMKNYRQLFAKLAGWLTPQGQLFSHVFTHATTPYHFSDDATSPDWLTRYFFLGGTMPSHHLFLYEQTDLLLDAHWAVDGTHYAKTAEAWLQRHHQHRNEILALFAETYGGMHVAQLWWHRWQAFFLACAELWAYKSGKEWLVSHYRFSKR
jgi:cyclopropane-fatty-acyl-phospholipid synthase